MSTPNFPRMYRLNTTGAPTNSVAGVSSGRRGDFVIDDAGNLFFYGGDALPALQAWQQIVTAPASGAIVLQPDDSTGNGFDITVHGGDAILPGPGDGGDVLLTGGTAANGIGGDVIITAGTGTTDPGDISLVGVAGVAGSNGSDILITGGDGDGAGLGGQIIITGGDNSTGAGSGGGILLSAGSNTLAGTGTGGNIDIVSGDSTAASNGGNINVRLGTGGTPNTTGTFIVQNSIQTATYFQVSPTLGVSLPYASLAGVNLNVTTLDSPSGRISTDGALNSAFLIIKNTFIQSSDSIVLITPRVLTIAVPGIVVSNVAGGSFTITAPDGLGLLNSIDFMFLVINPIV